MKTAKNSQNIISTKGIYKSFKTGDRYTNVLKNVSLDIAKGEFLIVFGPSGCGKSTLLHIIMGLERPDAGIVKLENVIEGLKKSLPERYHHLIPLNEEAITKGMEKVTPYNAVDHVY